MMSNFIGPVLPDHLKNKVSEDDNQPEVIGPVLPPGWSKKDEDPEEDDGSMIGPALPPNLVKKRGLEEDDIADIKDKLFEKGSKSLKKSVEDEKKIIGPTLPPNFSSSKDKYPEARADLPKKNSSNSNGIKDNSNVDDNSDDDDDEFTIGPLPPSGNFIEVEESRHQRSQQDESKPKVSLREEWIASLPETSSVARKLGFGQSMTRFAQKPVSSKEIEPVEQDTELSESVDQYNKITRPDALVDIHKKQLTTKKPEEKQTRSLFDFNPEEDLKIKQMDSQHAKSIVDKAKLLNSRFANPRGSNKFL
ncbi:GPALPP motifs-containing protein 1 [Tetranychus urticae]|uniref:DUF3752 domain-containing protein n=1 Tax=Tetranychus urticae TaxID=32264 RepID=T1JYH8_TETUR|nr:GPALPP motifs-containing protein 1 [Tetranychus urticae]